MGLRTVGRGGAGRGEDCGGVEPGPGFRGRYNQCPTLGDPKSGGHFVVVKWSGSSA